MNPTWSQVFAQADALDAKGTLHSLNKAEMGFTYRHSGVPEDWIFVGGAFEGRADDPKAIHARIQDIQTKREESQPIRARTGGSTFVNPTGHKAWKLIDDAGCRGLRKGDAMVSEKHCNFLINTGNASRRRHRIPGRGSAPPRARPQRHRADLGNQAHRPPGGESADQERRASMKRVSVLMGGPSAEREVSLNSGANCAAALKERPATRSRPIDVTRDLPALLKAIKAQKPDVLFNALHGRWVEDGNIQGILNYVGIPYTHSGLMASAIAMDKPTAKRLFADGRPALPQGRAAAQVAGHEGRLRCRALRREAGQRRLQRRRRSSPRAAMPGRSTASSGRTASSCCARSSSRAAS